MIVNGENCLQFKKLNLDHYVTGDWSQLQPKRLLYLCQIENKFVAPTFLLSQCYIVLHILVDNEMLNHLSQLYIFQCLIHYK